MCLSIPCEHTVIVVLCAEPVCAALSVVVSCRWGVADPTTLVVVGAAAVLGAACRAPLTAFGLMVEITRWEQQQTHCQIQALCGLENMIFTRTRPLHGA